MAPPFTAILGTHDGSGVDLDGWSWVTLRAHVAPAVATSPSVVRQAILQDSTVRVRTRCRGRSFEVTELRPSR